MDAVAALQARREEASADLRQVRRALRRQQDRDRKRRRVTIPATAATMTPRDTTLILSALWIVDFVFTDSLTLLEHVRGPPAWGSLDTAGRGRLVENLFLDAGIHEVEAMVDATRMDNLLRLEELWVIHAEWQTARWVGDVNRERGVAPSSMLVYDRYSQLLLSTPEGVQHRCLRCRTTNAKRLWAVRWRRRWGAAMGKLAIGDLDPPDVLEAKAWQLSFLLARINRNRSAALACFPHYGSRFRGRF